MKTTPCAVRNENSENIFSVYCPKKVSLVFFRCKCRLNFQDFLSAFNWSPPCDVIKSRLKGKYTSQKLANVLFDLIMKRLKVLNFDQSSFHRHF